MAVFQPQIVGKGGATYIAGKGINIDEESKEISVVDPVLVNESTIEGVVQIGDYELLDSNGTIPEDRLANTTSAIQGQILTLDINKNAIWADPDALPASTKYGASLVLSIDSGTYVVTAQLKDQHGNNLGNPQTIDLPLESVVISGRYDESTKKVILTLQNGSTVEFSIADLVDGLQNQMQFSNMPEASSTNEGMVIQYIGGTIPDVDPTAVATQTVGSGLSDLSVDVKKFESTERPSGSETVDFVANVIQDTIDFSTQSGDITFNSSDANAFKSYVKEWAGGSWYSDYNNAAFTYSGDNTWDWGPQDGGIFRTFTTDELTAHGISIVGIPANGDTVFYSYIAGEPSWTKNGITIDLTSYGISYSGAPADGDTISVAYTPGEKGITQGYFYANQPKYSDASATISQTVGSSLTDLSVNVDKFEETEHLTQSGNTSFVAGVNVENAALGTIVGTFVCNLNSAEFLARLVATWGNEWWDVLDTKNPYFVYTNGGWALSSQDGSTTISDPDAFVKSYGVANTDWGFYVTDDSMVQVGDYVSVIYTEAGVFWSKNGTTVDLANYGISYSGTPADGDALTVAYTAPVMTGYAWNQINVQPSSSSGGGRGIEWKATLDLPVNYSGPQWETSAIVTIPGGLPDGDYEFYYRTLCYSEPEDAPKRYATTKVQFHFDSANSTCSGSFAPVIDGNWMPSGNYSIGSSELWNVFGSRKKDFVFLCMNRPFATDVPAYNDVSGGLKDCFKVSSFKNIHTGQEYIPVLALYDGTSNPKEFEYAGRISMKPLQNDPYIPQYHSTNQWEYNDNRQYVRIQPSFAISHSAYPAQCSELDVSLVSNKGGKWHCIVENGYNSYVARVLEASGDLANAQIGFNSSNQTFLFFNTESGTYGSIYASIGAKGSSEAVSGWSEEPDSFTPATITKVGMTVTADNIGAIEQYTGETNDNYTNGYFYKATGDEVVVPATTVCNQTFGEANIDITCLDFDGFVTALAGYIGWSEDHTKEELSNESFMAYRPTEYNKWLFSHYGEIPDSVGIGNYFTLSPEPTGEIQFTVNHTDSHTEIQNGRWEQVDVQPSSGGLPDQTGHTGFLQTDGIEASWSDKAPLVNDYNPSTAAGALVIKVENFSKLTNIVSMGHDNTAVGMDANAYRGTAIGNSAQVSYVGGTAIGRYTKTSQKGAIAIGDSASSTAQGTILLNASNTRTTNQTPDTFMVANTQGAYTLMSADGTIPAERLAADGTTGQVLSKTDTGMEWKDVAGGGDYLPLSGGTMTGAIDYEVPSWQRVDLLSKTTRGSTDGIIGATDTGVEIGNRIAGNVTICGNMTWFSSTDNVFGGQYRYCQQLFVKNLNAGIENGVDGQDIVVPQTGGTMVVATPPTENGTYVLKATVVDGVVTTTWVAE